MKTLEMKCGNVSAPPLASQAVSLVCRPLDFLGTFSNRWSYGIAFGATANKIMFLFSEGYQPLQIPQWAQGTRAASHLLGILPRPESLKAFLGALLPVRFRGHLDIVEQRFRK